MAKATRHRDSRLCTCAAYCCGDNSFVDSKTQRIIKGRYIGYKLYQTHRTAQLRLERRQWQPENSSSQSVVPPGDPQPLESVIPPGPSTFEDRDRLLRRSLSATSSQGYGPTYSQTSADRPVDGSERTSSPTESERSATYSDRTPTVTEASVQSPDRNPIPVDRAGSRAPRKPKASIVKGVNSVRVVEHWSTIFYTGRQLEISALDLVLADPPASDVYSQQPPEVLRLRRDVASNSSFLEYEHWLFTLMNRVDSIITYDYADGDVVKANLMAAMESEWERLEGLKLWKWREQYGEVRARMDQLRALENPFGEINTARHFIPVLRDAHPIIVAVYILIATLHLICGISLVDCGFALDVLHVIVELSLSFAGTLAGRALLIVKSIPSDARTVLKSLHLLPPTHAFVCCPDCFACYPDTGPESYPERCIFQSTPSSVKCNRTLRKTRTIRGKKYTYPVRHFIYHDFKEWVGSLYCRHAMEDLLDRQPSLAENGGKMRDIWDAGELSSFCGPDGKPFFEPEDPAEGRLVFSLCMDGFNPYQNKQAGKKVTTGAMYMVCLNLPPAVRYRIENMFLVGIIPGPNHPSLEQINHVLRPIVDHLLEFWWHGVRYSRTPNYDEGRRARAALVPLICDLPAARQMAGFAGQGMSLFCSYCYLTAQDINNLDYESWILRDGGDHRAHAEEWRDASSENEREAIFSRWGVRYSELLRLPYWDPTRFTVVDTMHALFLGNLKRHCRGLWGMDFTFHDGDGTLGDPIPKGPTDAAVRNGFEVLKTQPFKKVEKLKMTVLMKLAEDCGYRIENKAKKAPYLKALKAHRIKEGWFDEKDTLLIPNPPASPAVSPTSALDPASDRHPDDDQPPIPIPPPPPNPSPASNLDLASELHPEEQKNADEYYESAPTTRSFMELRKLVLVHLCVVKLRAMRKDMDRLTKAELSSKIGESRTADGLADRSGNLIAIDGQRFENARKANRRTKTRVLGRERLQQIWDDMEKTSLPTWVSRAPRRCGDGKHGKIYADQWRTFCTIHLVITLNRIWGSYAEDRREFQMLSNFMDLVAATRLASMRSMSGARADQYLDYMIKYLKGILTLFPHLGISVNNHLSVHLGHIFKRFGPGHAWRCFVFERWNYMLQQINTNMHFGELERTMFERLCMGQELRHIIQDGKLTEQLQRIVPAFERAFHSDNRGTLLSDMLVFQDFDHPSTPIAPTKKTRLPAEFSEMLRSRNMGRVNVWVSSLKHVDFNGVRYSTFDSNPGDSYIAIGSNVPDDWAAARVHRIFARNEDDIFFVVEKFKDMAPSDAAMDPYRRSPVAGGRLYYDEFSSQDIVTAREIICHFAHTPFTSLPIATPCIHALPLNKD